LIQALQQVPGIIIAETRPQSQVIRLHPKRREWLVLVSETEAKAQSLIDDLLEGPAGTPDLRSQLDRDVVIEG
jgi:hypothetical protein